MAINHTVHDFGNFKRLSFENNAHLYIDERKDHWDGWILGSFEEKNGMLNGFFFIRGAREKMDKVSMEGSIEVIDKKISEMILLEEL